MRHLGGDLGARRGHVTRQGPNIVRARPRVRVRVGVRVRARARVRDKVKVRVRVLHLGMATNCRESCRGW